jgi:hypothetical protein
MGQGVCAGGRPSGAEFVEDRGRQRHDTARLFGGTDGERASPMIQAALDVHPGAVQIDMAPAQSKQFAAPRAGRQSEADHQSHPIIRVGRFLDEGQFARAGRDADIGVAAVRPRHAGPWIGGDRLGAHGVIEGGEAEPRDLGDGAGAAPGAGETVDQMLAEGDSVIMGDPPDRPPADGPVDRKAVPSAIAPAPLSCGVRPGVVLPGTGRRALMKCVGCGGTAITERALTVRLMATGDFVATIAANSSTSAVSVSPIALSIPPSRSWVFFRLGYKLSLRDLAKMFLLRGIGFSHETVRQWEALLTPALISALRSQRSGGGRVGRSWYTDETHVRVRGRWHYLYRAVDRAGNLVDVMLSGKRDMAAAIACFRSAKTVTGVTPARVATDGHDCVFRRMSARHSDLISAILDRSATPHPGRGQAGTKKRRPAEPRN